MLQREERTDLPRTMLQREERTHERRTELQGGENRLDENNDTGWREQT